MPNITDRDSAFDWVEQFNPFARDTRHDAGTDGYLRYLQEKAAARGDCITDLRQQLDYNRRYRRVWRFTAIVALIALAIAVYQWAMAVSYASC